MAPLDQRPGKQSDTRVMISKQDILDRATEWQLRPTVVEKDSALGWLLAALASHPATRALWILKGGTCIHQEVLRRNLPFLRGPGPLAAPRGAIHRDSATGGSDSLSEERAMPWFHSCHKNVVENQALTHT
jgi:hypothetical protein